MSKIIRLAGSPTPTEMIGLDTGMYDEIAERDARFVAHHVSPNKHFLQRFALYLESYRKQRAMARMLPERDAEFLDEVLVHNLMVIQILRKLSAEHGPVIPAVYGYDEAMDTILFKVARYLDSNNMPLVSLVELNEVNVVLQNMIIAYYRPPVEQRSFWENIKALFS